MGIQPRDGFGYGIILISAGLGNNVMPDAKIDEVTIMGELRNQGVLEQIHRNLLLPERYTVIAVFFQFYRGHWAIMVEAPVAECPRVDPGAYLPNIAPVYRILADGTRHLERLDVDTKRPEERVLCPD